MSVSLEIGGGSMKSNGMDLSNPNPSTLYPESKP